MTVTEKWTKILIISSLQLILWEPQTSFYILNFFFPALSCGGGGSHLVMSDSLHPHGL